MEKIIRRIGAFDFMIDPHKSNEVYFEQDFMLKYGITSEELTTSEICSYISKDRYIPLVTTWELLDKCNFGCSFCYIVGHSKHKIVRFEEMKADIDLLIDKGLLYCLLTGGEVTMHPDFIQIYTHLKQNGVLVEIYTNGSLLSNEILQVFKDLPPYRIEISIYGTSQSNFEIVAGTTKFRFDEVLTNILQLQKDGQNIRCKSPVNNLTEREFSNVSMWCNEHNIEFYYSTDICEAYDKQDLKNFAVDYDSAIRYEAEKRIDLEIKYAENTSSANNPKGKTCYTCGIRNYGLHINSNFDLMPCSETHFEQSKSSIREIGIEKAIEKYRNFVTPMIGRDIIGCTGCEASNFCKMCSAKAETIKDAFGNISDFKVPDGHCENQRKKANFIVQKIMDIA